MATVYHALMPSMPSMSHSCDWWCSKPVPCHSTRPSATPTLITLVALVALIALVALVTLVALIAIVCALPPVPTTPFVARIAFVAFVALIPLVAFVSLIPLIAFVALISLVPLVSFVSLVSLVSCHLAWRLLIITVVFIIENVDRVNPNVLAVRVAVVRRSFVLITFNVYVIRIILIVRCLCDASANASKNLPALPAVANPSCGAAEPACRAEAHAPATSAHVVNHPLVSMVTPEVSFQEAACIIGVQKVYMRKQRGLEPWSPVVLHHARELPEYNGIGSDPQLIQAAVNTCHHPKYVYIDFSELGLQARIGCCSRQTKIEVSRVVMLDPSGHWP